MKIVSPLLKKVVYPSLSAAGVLRRTAARGLAVVTYHGVLPEGYEPVDSGLDGNLVTAEMLGRQLRSLKPHYDVISPEDLLAWLDGQQELPSRAVLITCDDGLLNCVTDMLPVLSQEKVKCLFFVTGASCGEKRNILWYEELFLLLLHEASQRPFAISHGGIEIKGELEPRERLRAAWWSGVKRLSQASAEKRRAWLDAARVQLGAKLEFNEAAWRRFGLMTRGEVQRLVEAGMTVGGHTLSHPVLSQAEGGEARREIGETKATIESVIGARVWAFAYPFGDAQSVTSEVLAMPREAGYRAAFLNYGGGLGSELLPYALPRIHVTWEMSWAELEAHVSGWYGRLRRMVG